jgi:hypothetical protein
MTADLEKVYGYRAKVGLIYTLHTVHAILLIKRALNGSPSKKGE